jgi:ubiquinone/menaquinone biosynthesis C-methylase UbiE
LYDRWAASYDRWLSHYDRWMGLTEGRRRLLSRASGRTLEVGVGTGVNLQHYPAEVRLTAIDLSPAMLEIAHRRADALGLAVDLQVGDAQALDLPKESFDTVVATLMLSAVPDDKQAAAELWRVLRPGGTLLVLDHVRSTAAPVALLQRLLEPIIDGLTGWRFARDVSHDVRSVGFTIEQARRWRLGMVLELVGRKSGHPGAAMSADP